jgi:hypothetical protein
MCKAELATEKELRANDETHSQALIKIERERGDTCCTAAKECSEQLVPEEPGWMPWAGGAVIGALSMVGVFTILDAAGVVELW